ncbi:MAG: aldo/keto reductase [Clostridiales bacterium]|nr:aldo/keto reductase [Clostridiales bacterium]
MECFKKEMKNFGFGLMRLPKTGEEIDVRLVSEMVDRFMAAGFTYFDTAHIYAGSESAARQALVERYPRESFQLATKTAAWSNCRNREEAISQFHTSLKQTGAEYFDYYLLHNMGGARTRLFTDYHLWDFVREQKEKGLIKHIGFSFHSTPDELDAILTAHPEAEFVQLQINYADWKNPAVQSGECYKVARKYNKPIIVMEPVKGGMLATPPASVREIFKMANPDASIASWAIRFAASLDGVAMVLSGMNTLAQMEDNLSFMENFQKLSEEEQDVIKKAQAALNAIPLIPCTTCNYCAKVCPENIGISGSFTAMNYCTLYNKEAAAIQLEMLVHRQGKAFPDQCICCGRCEEACPQHIAIRQELKKVTKTFL